VTFDADFPGAIRGCATSGKRRDKTWLTAPMIRSYTRLFELGHCHSAEVWHENELAGGCYGLAIGGLFAAESMWTSVQMPTIGALAGRGARQQVTNRSGD
jgi:leucyl/phenylalanyl-tRNA--protein transferase